MSTFKKLWSLIILSIFLLTPVMTSAQVQAQADKKQAELKKLETSLNAAKAKVALNEKQLNKSDSLITAGNKMISDAKSDTKAVDADRKKLDKEYAANQKSLMKLSTSKDKEEATKAKSDLKALDTKYRSDVKEISTRQKDATKMLTTGNSNLAKGKAGKKNAQDALKISKKALETAQEKYDNANAPDEKTASKDKKKK